MSDAITKVSASGSTFSPAVQSPELGVPRSINSSGAESSTAQQAELDGLLSELAVHATLAGFVMMRDEMRRQTEMMASRLKEAREESE